jgi:hypothetical protein
MQAFKTEHNKRRQLSFLLQEWGDINTFGTAPSYGPIIQPSDDDDDDDDDYRDLEERYLAAETKVLGAKLDPVPLCRV